jgi:hypothetical protein
MDNVPEFLERDFNLMAYGQHPVPNVEHEEPLPPAVRVLGEGNDGD